MRFPPIQKNLINYKNRDSKFALVLDWDFHRSNRWVSAFGPYFIESYLERFRPVIISNQSEYDSQRQVKFLLSLEPGWASPRLSYKAGNGQIKLVMYSDPHYDVESRQQYFFDNDFTLLLSLYYHPFFFNFVGFPKDKFVHFPWAVPDQFVNKGKLSTRGNEVMIFGGKGSDAYDIRNWCREQPGVTSYDNSGVENKKLTDEKYYIWLRQFDAIIAAGSSNPKYDMVTPKYFEIAAAGSLLIGQHCRDLELLGFNEGNSVIFTKGSFGQMISEYRDDPNRFLQRRELGRKLILERHTISVRMKQIESIFQERNDETRQGKHY